MNQLQVIEYSGQRVLTTSQLAESFGTDNKNLNDNYQNNSKRYVPGKHYFYLEGEELKAFKASTEISGNLKYAPALMLWTEKGAWMHAKSLNTDQAWEAYEALVDDYYSAKQPQIDISKLSPEMQMFKLTFDAVAKVQLENAQTKQELNGLKETVSTIKETFLARDDDWRKSINLMLNTAARQLDESYKEIRSISYDTLELRAKCDLNRRLANLRERLADSGATKTKINETNRLDVIESDPRLKEIYTTIVKELSIGTLA